jgi:hypothetical protein
MDCLLGIVFLSCANGLFLLFFFFFGDTKASTQGLTLARQAGT